VRRRAARRIAVWSAASAAALLLAGAAWVSAEVAQKEELRVTVIGQVKPYRLPRQDPAPIAVFVSGHIGTVDRTAPPQLEQLVIRLNRHGLLQYRGLPVCRIDQIQPASTALALSRCGDAVVGSGQFWAHIVLPDQRPYPTSGRLLVFNGRSTCGPESAGCRSRPVLFAHIFSTRPFATSFVIAFHIDRLRNGGAYGTRLTASLPQALGSWGYVDRIKLTLRRKYEVRGRKRSYFNSACPAPAGFTRTAFSLARADFRFVEGRTLSVGVTKDCRVKP
jgi:hypothetical protein